MPKVVLRLVLGVLTKVMVAPNVTAVDRDEFGEGWTLWLKGKVGSWLDGIVFGLEVSP